MERYVDTCSASKRICRTKKLKNLKKIVDFEPHYTISFCELEWFDILTTSVFSNQPNYLHYSNKDSDWLMLLTK